MKTTLKMFNNHTLVLGLGLLGKVLLALDSVDTDQEACASPGRADLGRLLT